jgi:hypothetical protein
MVEVSDKKLTVTALFKSAFDKKPGCLFPDVARESCSLVPSTALRMLAKKLGFLV